jgi:D-serine deaminase-like pyridoxal phosphate-dependent protein
MMVEQQPCWQEIDTPALLIDLPALDRNLAAMAAAFAGGPVGLRPHAKTHKCAAIARRQIAAGAHGITCAKVGEAEAMVGGGLRDILIANQVVGPRKIARLVSIASTAAITVAVDNPLNVDELGAACDAEGVTLGVLVETDVGMGRAGVRSLDACVSLAHHVARTRGLRFRGLMGYEGHVVDLAGFAERERGARESLERLSAARRVVEEAGLEVECLSAGGTGTYTITSRWPDLTEAQVGSYVFMDANYIGIEGMEAFSPSLTVLATVTSRPSPDLVVVDAGLKTMGAEYAVARLMDWPQAKGQELSEEHGRFTFPEEPGLRVGDKVRIIPPHCCTTSNLHERFYVIRDGAIDAIWPIEARGHSQ